MKTTTTTMTTASRAAGRVAVRIGKGPLVDGGLRANGRRHPATRPPRCSDGHSADPEPPFVYRAPSSAHSQLHDVARVILSLRLNTRSLLSSSPVRLLSPTGLSSLARRGWASSGPHPSVHLNNLSSWPILTSAIFSSPDSSSRTERGSPPHISKASTVCAALKDTHGSSDAQYTVAPGRHSIDFPGSDTTVNLEDIAGCSVVHLRVSKS
jgi:hypothetical protein